MKKIMKKTIFILSVLFFLSCKKECYLMDKAGNQLPFTGDVRSAYSEYLSTGKTTINGNTYYKVSNDLMKICD